MTGSLKTKKNSKYYYVLLNLHPDGGKRKQKWIKTGIIAFDKKKKQINIREANAYLSKTLYEYQENKTEVINNILFSDYMLQWLDVIEKQVESNTFYEYKKVITNDIVPYFKKRKIKLQDLRIADLQLFYESEEARGLKPCSVRKRHANIHKALKRAVTLQIIKFNPADYVQLSPLGQKFHASYYNAEQANSLIEIAKGHYAESVIYLTAFFGFRRSEVLGLKWSSIDFEKHSIFIKDTVTTVGGKSLEKPRTKNKSSHRTLHMASNIEQYLKRLQKKQLEDKLFFGNTYFDSEYVCRQADGSFIKPSYLTQSFKQLLTEHNMPVIRFHDLRHSCASLLLANGFSLKEIQEWLGHSEISTTADLYGHLESDSKEKMAESIGKSLIIA